MTKKTSITLTKETKQEFTKLRDDLKYFSYEDLVKDLIDVGFFMKNLLMNRELKGDIKKNEGQK